MKLCIHPTTHSAVKQGEPTTVWFSILQSQRYNRRALLHSEVIGCQTSIVDVENQAGIVGGGIKHLEQVHKRKRLFRLQTVNTGQHRQPTVGHLH